MIFIQCHLGDSRLKNFTSDQPSLLLVNNGNSKKVHVIKKPNSFYKYSNLRENNNRLRIPFLVYIVYSTCIHTVSLHIYSDVNVCACTHMHITSPEKLHHHYLFRGTDSETCEPEDTSLLHNDFLHYITLYISY